MIIKNRREKDLVFLWLRNISYKEHGLKITLLKALKWELIHYIKGNLEWVENMGKGLVNGWMDKNMLDNGKMVSEMAMDFGNLKMDSKLIVALGIREKFMAMASILKREYQLIREIFKILLKLDKESNNSIMEINLKDNIKMGYHMVLVLTNGLAG